MEDNYIVEVNEYEQVVSEALELLGQESALAFMPAICELDQTMVVLDLNGNVLYDKSMHDPDYTPRKVMNTIIGNKSYFDTESSEEHSPF